MLLELKNIDKSFGEKEVLKGVSFIAESGKAFGLLGRNGAGKTTTIRILMNVLPANNGEVLVDGEPINWTRLSSGRKRIVSQKTDYGSACIFCGIERHAP